VPPGLIEKKMAKTGTYIALAAANINRALLLSHSNSIAHAFKIALKSTALGGTEIAWKT